MPSLEVGIVGLPNAGKSTLFNALLGRQIAHVAEYPFTTIEPNVGVVEVPDGRLPRLAEIVSGAARGVSVRSFTDASTPSRSARGVSPPADARDSCSLAHDTSPAPLKVIPAAIKFIDIAGLVKDAHKGAGLGNQFLGKIRECQAILHTVRAFENPQAVHPLGNIDPERDIEIINNELKQAGIEKPTFVYLNKEYPDEHALDEVIRECYKLLDLITMFTVEGGQQVQAWPIKRGTVAKEAVGMIHSDFAGKFIRAEVVPFEKLDVAGSYLEAKSKGWVRVEGKDYVVKDGDVITVHITRS